MRVIVNQENKGEVLAYLSSLSGGVIALDTETYGLKWDAKLFALQLAVKNGDSFYFNFHNYNDQVCCLDRSIFGELDNLWHNSNIRWVMANAKFDLRRIDIEGVRLNGEIYDVLLMARIAYNREFSYSLDACLKRMGMAKNDEVSLWIKDNKAYTTYHVDGKKTKEKDLHYDRVPFDIMVRYGFDDVENTLSLYDYQTAYFEKPEHREQINLVHSNIELTKTVFAMERHGIQLDIQFCKEMYEKEIALVNETASRIEQLTDMKFKAGPKWLKEVFDAQGITLELSEKGNPILDKNALKAIPNAIAHYVLEMRDHEKRAGTFQALTRFADSNGVLHTNYRLNGTDTLRFSSNDPNLQNIEACEKGNYETPRTAFKPREGFSFVSIDYKAMEYRLVADIAGEHGWIKAISEGADPHQFVADLMAVERTPAKTINFQNLYGGGDAKLAQALFKCFADLDTLKALAKKYLYKYNKLKSPDQALVNLFESSHTKEQLENDVEQLHRASTLKAKYFESLPAVEAFMDKVQEVGKERGFVRNKFGARFFLGDNASYAYKLPNHLIQGTGATVIRSAMNKIAFFLEGFKSRMILQVHDELIYEIHISEGHIIPELKRIMEDEYKPINGMKMECDVEFSTESWNANTFKRWSEDAWNESIKGTLGLEENERKML